MANIHEKISTMQVDGKYFIIDTDFLLANLHDTTLWKGCPDLVNYDLLQCIREIKERNDYPYNRTVGQLFCDKHNLGEYAENSFLSAMVYTTQHYEQDIVDAQNEKMFALEMAKQGFTKATDELLQQAVNTKRKFLVALNTTNFLGGEGKRVSEDKLILKDWGENGGLHWMNPRAKRSGYKATIGQYIKEVTEWTIEKKDWDRVKKVLKNTPL